MGNLEGRRGRKLFLAVVVAEHMEVAALYRQVKLVVLAYASENSETLVSEGHHLHDENITYYDASVLLKFVGSGTATQHEFMILAELAPPSVLTAIGPGGSRRAWRLKLWVAS